MSDNLLLHFGRIGVPQTSISAQHHAKACDKPCDPVEDSVTVSCFVTKITGEREGAGPPGGDNDAAKDKHNKV